MVASGDSSSSQDENSVKADHDNLHDVNAKETPSNFTVRVDVVVLVESIIAITERIVNTAYGFFLGKRVAYPVVANYVRNTWGKYGLVKSMLSSSTRIFSFQFSSMGPCVPVWVKLHGIHVTAFSEDGLIAITTKLGTHLMLDSYPRALIEVGDDVELKDNIVVVMPKLVGEGFYTCNVRVEYEWKSPRCTCCKVFSPIQDECPKNKDSNVVKNMKKHGQTHRGVSLGHKVGFQPAKQVYRQVLKVENDVYLGTNRGTSNLASKKANSSLSSFWNVDSSSISTTSNVENFDKIERLIIDGTTTLVDNEGKPLTRVDSSGGHNSDEVAPESYWNEEYNYDSYDDDMYEVHDIPDKIQDISDNLDIKVHGRKKR
nr:hypothetical protein [Tanacetum cinerariifolium]